MTRDTGHVTRDTGHVMAVLDPGAGCWVLLVGYILVGYCTADTVLWLGGVLGLLVLTSWTRVHKQ